MEFRQRITRALHDEHISVMALLERLESLLRAHGRAERLQADDDVAARILGDFAAAMDGEIATHFEFEESGLFPPLDEMGASTMVEILSEEHLVILPLGRRLADLARRGPGAFDAQTWREFRPLASELIERLASHIQKEEMGMLPSLEEALDEAEDARLADAYDRARLGAASLDRAS